MTRTYSGTAPVGESESLSIIRVDLQGAQAIPAGEPFYLMHPRVVAPQVPTTHQK